MSVYVFIDARVNDFDSIAVGLASDAMAIVLDPLLLPA